MIEGERDAVGWRGAWVGWVASHSIRHLTPLSSLLFRSVIQSLCIFVFISAPRSSLFSDPFRSDRRADAEICRSIQFRLKIAEPWQELDG